MRGLSLAHISAVHEALWLEKEQHSLIIRTLTIMAVAVAVVESNSTSSSSSSSTSRIKVIIQISLLPFIVSVALLTTCWA
jgi:hypothetical protein